jgi:hypothetical protein
LYVLDAETGEELKKFDTGGTIAGGAPAIVRGRIVVKSGLAYSDPATKGNDEIICYALPAPADANTGGAGGASGMAGHAAVGGAAATPPSSASFSALYSSLIVAQGCSSGQCHSTFAAGALDMSSKDVAYKNLVGVKAMGMDPAGTTKNCSESGLVRVAPRDPAASLLVSKLEHTQSCGGPMPNAGTTLPADTLSAVRAWIMNGAPND